MTRYPYLPDLDRPLLRPSVPVVAYYGTRASELRALADTGATMTLLDRNVADRLGVEIGRKGAERTQLQVLGRLWDVQLEHVDLSLVGSGETWTAQIAFAMSHELRMPFDGLLGSHGFFDRFVVTFAQYHGWVQVEHASHVPPV